MQTIGSAQSSSGAAHWEESVMLVLTVTHADAAKVILLFCSSSYFKTHLMH